jgi:single-strand DNA-binding protein
MMSLNRVLLIGNLTKDPELRYTPSGTPVASLRLAVNSTFKDQTGARKEETCFVTIIVWSRQAEICNQYLKKGRPVFVEGRLIYRSWEADGKTRSTMEVRADRVQFLGPPPGAPPGVAREGTERAQAPEPSEGGASVEVEAAADGSSDTDVPF